MSPVLRTTGATTRPSSEELRPAKTGSAPRKPNATTSSRSAAQHQRIRGSKKIVRKELPAFSRQMAAMLAAGMPIVAALETVEEQTVNPNFKLAINHVRKSIEGGASFSESLQQMPAIFDDLYVNMVRSGEQSGQFAETMKRIGELLEANARLRRKVKSAMTYPIVVLTLAIVIALGMIIFIVPVFAQMYTDFGAKLPGPTQFLVDLSNAGKKYSIVIIPAIIALVIAFKKWKKTDHGALILDGLFLRAPVVGVLVQKVSVARFSRTLAQLVQSGVPILGALEIVARASGNRVMEAAILDARKAVEHGDTLSSGLSNKHCMPTILIRMLSAGEKTGKVDEMLESVADTFDDEVDAMLASLTSMLEPLLMVFLGVIIGGIVVCMFLPIFKMSEVVAK